MSDMASQFERALEQNRGDHQLFDLLASYRDICTDKCQLLESLYKRLYASSR